MLNYKALRKIKGNPSAETTPGRRLKLGPEFREYAYDMPIELVAAVSGQFPPEQWAKAAGETDEEFLQRQGREFMAYLMEQADLDKFRDRTGEMIDLVAKQTGIGFPHRFERYLELGVLSLRPRDAWSIVEATTRRLRLRSYNCSLSKVLAERGIHDCQAFCLSASATIAAKLGEALEMEQSVRPGDTAYCELSFRRA